MNANQRVVLAVLGGLPLMVAYAVDEIAGVEWFYGGYVFGFVIGVVWMAMVSAVPRERAE